MNVSYDQVGTGEPAVVLIHGWAFGNASHLVPQFEHVRSRRRAVLLDLPGQGASDPAPARFGFAECAAAIAGVVAGAGIGQAVLLGHSFGGRLAVEVAAAHPERIAGVALVDPVLLFPAPVRQQAARLASSLESDGWRAALEAYFSALLSPDDRPEVRSRVLAELGGVDPVLGAQVMRAGMASDGSAALARVGCPVLVIRRPELPLDGRRLQELQPHAWIAQPVGTGHWMTISVPDQVNTVLDRFLASLAGPSPRPDGPGEGHRSSTTATFDQPTRGGPREAVPSQRRRRHGDGPGSRWAAGGDRRSGLGPDLRVRLRDVPQAPQPAGQRGAVQGRRVAALHRRRRLRLRQPGRLRERRGQRRPQQPRTGALVPDPDEPR